MLNKCYSSQIGNPDLNFERNFVEEFSGIADIILAPVLRY
jgi:hypothetical protein